MCGFFRKEMVIEKWHLIAHVHNSRKRTIQSWISFSQNMSHDFYSQRGYENT